MTKIIKITLLENAGFLYNFMDSASFSRYFACKPRYGLFAPAAKVVRSLDQTDAKKFKIRHTRTSTLRLHRSGSQESLSSVGLFYIITKKS